MKQAITFFHPARAAGLAVLAGALACTSVPVSAQDTVAEVRLRKMEAEIKALQRKVFPGGDGKFFQPEITPPAPGQANTVSDRPATNAVTDILTRLDALEAQIASLTGQVEQNSNRIAQLEARKQPAETAVSAEAAAPAEGAEPEPEEPTAAQSNLNAMTGGASVANPQPKPVAKPASAPAPAPKPAAPSAERVEAVSKIVKPQTDDPADDDYSYGFRLWDAKFYPEAQQQLTIFAEKYPKHWRASWGRNLLGRAYLDDGKPREAAKWFLQNYQADKTGGRAPDSLLYLAVAMKQLEDTKRACIALAEFSETYAAEAEGRLMGLYQSTRDGLDCSI